MKAYDASILFFLYVHTAYVFVAKWEIYLSRAVNTLTWRSAVKYLTYRLFNCIKFQFGIAAVNANFDIINIVFIIITIAFTSSTFVNITINTGIVLDLAFFFFFAKYTPLKGDEISKFNNRWRPFISFFFPFVKRKIIFTSNIKKKHTILSNNCTWAIMSYDTHVYTDSEVSNPPLWHKYVIGPLNVSCWTVNNTAKTRHF